VTRTLLLLRHAKADRDDPSLADYDRPLTRRGRRDAQAVGLYLVAHDLVPDHILASPALRARETAELAVSAWGDPEDIDLRPALYATDTDAYRAELAALPADAERALVVAHNETLEELLAELTDRAERLRTAACAEIALDITAWSELGAGGGNGRLVQIWRPGD
jgi:phosphohistidine phosphatase